MNDSTSPYSRLAGEDQAALSVLLESFQSRLGHDGKAALAGAIEHAPGRLRAALLSQSLPLVIEQRRAQHALTPTLHELRLAYPDLRSEIAEVYPWLPAEQRLPTEIGGYRVVASIGEGAQSVVLKGQDDVHGAVAIKLSVSARHNELLLRERETLAECAHPGVVSVIASGLHHDRAYFVMPLLAGSTLADRHRSRRPGVREAVGLAAQLAAAVAHLHGKGFLHRDLKPANVWVDEGGRLTLLDLGMAVRPYRFGAQARPLDEFHGTPAFMAPEQAREEADSDGRLTDVFGIGAVFCWMLSGHAPFEAETTKAALENSSAGVLNVEARQGLQNHPEAVRRACLEAIATDPAQRTPSAATLAETLNTAHERLLRREIAAERKWYSSPHAAVLMLLVGLAGTGYALQSQPERTTAFRPVIGQASAAESWLTQVAARQEIEPESIRPDELALRPRSAERLAGLGYAGPDGARARGVLVVEASPRLADLAESLSYRCGERRWRSLSHESRPGTRYALLDERDLALGGPVELRLGGEDGLPVFAGPFSYDVPLAESVEADADALRTERIEAALQAEWLRPDSPRWELAPSFVTRHVDQVRGLRFGIAPDRLDRLVTFAKPAAYAPEEAFLTASRELQSSAVLWAQLELLNGRLSDPRPHRRLNQYGQDGSADRARELLASFSEYTRYGRMRETRFVPTELAQIGLALASIELGEAEDQMTLRVPVVAQQSEGFIRRDNRGALYRRTEQLLNPPADIRLTQQDSVAAIDNGVPVSAVPVPPSWEGVYFRGRFHEGGVTPTYYARNEERRPGFKAELVEVAPGGEATDAFVYAYPPFRQPRPTGPMPAAVLKADAWLHAVLPQDAASVDYFADAKLSEPLMSLRPGLVFARFLDRQGRVVSTTVYRVAEEPLDGVLAEASP